MYLPKNDFNEIELPKDIISSGVLIEKVFGKTQSECMHKERSHPDGA